ncbi:DHHC zinc finger domain protein [Ancylostoma caninum]|uniref:Palmitoyltransferase n=1 Tax=Ancylostoma caninum TaxID=29170 RepID=A0A368FHR8_ANCCA|nr:DHHC zinc finger domain protein [Ancylostoma caninum]
MNLVPLFPSYLTLKMSANLQEATARAVEACQRGSMEALEAALKDGVPPNATDADGCSLLHWAAINNRLDIIARLLELGADPNVVGGLLVSSPLHWAARVGHSNSAALLVKAGAVANVRDTQGYAPIHLAVQTNQSTLVAYLLEKFDYCKDITDNSGMTPVMWAAYRTFGMFPIRLLIRAGADLNAQEHLSGNTALHIAAQERNYCSVRELLAGNADFLLRNKQQETPMDIAKNMRNYKIIGMIEDAMISRGYVRARCTACDYIPWSKIERATGFLVPGLLLGLIALLFFLFHYLAVGAVMFAAFIVFHCVSQFDFHTVSQSLVPIGICVAEPVCMIITWFVYLHYFVSWWLQIAFVLVMCLLFWSLLRIVFSDPGVIKPTENSRAQFVEMLELCERVNYCFTCWVNKPKGAKHCSICDRFVYLHYFVSWWLQIAFVLVMCLLFWSLLRIVFSNPGVIKPTENSRAQFVEMLELCERVNYCFTCWVNKPKGAKHCSICDRCVLDFDHHCPWLHQCITNRNLRMFLVFVACVALSAGIFSYACSHLIYLKILSINTGDSPFKLITIADEVLKTSSWLLFSLTLAFFHAIMLSALFVNQCVQISENLTTMDRIRQHRGFRYAPVFSDSEESASEPAIAFSTRVRNVVDFCIGSF